MAIYQNRPIETISVYASSRDPALQASFGMSESIEYFVAKIDDLGLSVPSSLVADVLQDAATKSGNLVKDHTTLSTMRPRITRPIKIGVVDDGSVYAACYPNGRLAVYLSGGRDDRVTINVPSIDLPEDEVLVKMAPENGKLREQLLRIGALKDTGLRHQVGFDTLEQWQVLMDFGGQQQVSTRPI
ncbi:hypothetical protein [Rhodoferax sp.]|uniref:hypothetical protein n=1 Tax=Rhodoferax sp. TaxID=50421 RepID=UPI002ACD530B|nr:hypothetical protein [Rhodoferax sp.]